jgi:hypothetical protein
MLGQIMVHVCTGSPDSFLGDERLAQPNDASGSNRPSTRWGQVIQAVRLWNQKLCRWRPRAFSAPGPGRDQGRGSARANNKKRRSGST